MKYNLANREDMKTVEIIRKQGLQIDNEERSWEEAIRICGELMLSLGSVEEKYIQSMVDVVHNLGPYIVVAPHIALAHAAAGEHVLKDDLVLTLFKKPVTFNSVNDPAHMMFGICALKPEAHLGLLRQLSEIIGDEERCEKILSCESVDELYTLVNNV